MSIEEKRRSAFEEFTRINNAEDFRHDGDAIFTRSEEGYDWYWVNEKWTYWNAALDSVVIELDDPSDPADFCYDAQVIRRSGAVDAIESAGLKVKP